MELKDAIEQIWKNRKYDTTSEIEILSHLNEEVAESLKALLKKDRKKALRELEDAVSCLFIAMKVFDINPEEVIPRQIERMKKSEDKIMYIYNDRVEIKVGDEIKGGWNIWSREDLEDAQKTAKEFGCKINIVNTKKED